MHKIGIYYDENSLRDILSSSKMENMEQQIMMSKKSQVEAAFLNHFGTTGSFKVSVVRSSNKTWKGKRFAGRVIFRIVPNDAKTYAILRKQPGWIEQFVN